MTYQVDGYTLPVIVERKKIKNTYLRVTEEYTLYITTNYLITNKQIMTFLEKSKPAIHKMLCRVIQKNENNEKFYYLGEIYDIILTNGYFHFNEISHKIYTPSMKELETYLKKQMVKLFQERLQICYQKMEHVPFPKLKIRKMKTRWGVCNKRDVSVTLNSELLRRPISEIDYVIFHELCHFLHFDHSPAFWKEVEKHVPNYKRVRKELKDS